MWQLLVEVLRHLTIIIDVILVCFASSEPLTLDPVCLLVFVPCWFYFNADVNSMYSADKSGNNIGR